MGCKDKKNILINKVIHRPIVAACAEDLIKRLEFVIFAYL